MNLKNLKNCFNYKKVFDDSIKIRQFGKLSLPMAVPLNRLILSAFLLLILYVFFKTPISWIDSLFHGLKFVMYLGIPYYISGVIVRLNPDGQKLHWYLVDLFYYLLFIRLPNKDFCQDEMIEKLAITKINNYETVPNEDTRR